MSGIVKRIPDSTTYS